MTENITVFGRGERYNRFRKAIDIQDACNPSGVAHELVRVIQDAMRDPYCTGTDFVRQDPAVQLVIDKLFDLCGRPDVWTSTRFGTSAYERCQVAAGQKEELFQKQAASK